MKEGAVETHTGAVEKPRRRSSLPNFFVRLVREKPLGVIGGIIVLFLLVVAIFADLLAPYGVNESDVWHRLEPPSAQHLLGTDNLGRDLLSRIIYGARISMYVGLGGSGLAAIVSTIIGLTSGFIGGKTDLVIQRFVDAWMCFPGLLLYLTLMAIIGQGLVPVLLVLGMTRGIGTSRVIRGAAISIKENVYVDAATAVGCSTRRIIMHHLLPNVMAPIITIFAVGCGYMIIDEASLSFLGFGIPPPAPSWGGMLSGSGRQYMYISPWLALWPGLALAIAVYGLNMFGDAVRDLLDPRLRGGLGRYGGVKARKLKRISPEPMAITKQ